MKTFLQLGAVLVLAALSSIDTANAQERRNNGPAPSPNASVGQTIGTTVVDITYGRPGLKSRALSTLAPAGKVWRTGANESTAITFSGDVMFGGEAVPAGTYSLYTIPNGDSWTIIINKKLSWGTQYDEAEDLVRVPAAVVKNDAPNSERFTTFFDTLTDDKAHLNIHWGTTLVAVPITLE